MKIFSVETIENAEVVILHGATLDGMGSIDGAFEVFDIDLCSEASEGDCVKVTVNCALDRKYDEESTISLIVPKLLITGCHGYFGEVVRELKSF